MNWLSQLYILIIIIFISSYVRSQQRIADGPSNTTVLLGGSIIMKCRIENQQGAVQWLKDGFGLGSDRDLPFYKRYSMEGSASMGEYNLRIINVEMSDEDEYACTVESINSNPSLISKPARLTVLVEPEDPKVLAANLKMKVIAGRFVQRSCISKHGKPAPVLNWAIVDNAEGAVTVRSTWLSADKSESLGNTVKTRRKIDLSNVRIVEDAHQNDDRTYNAISNISVAFRPEDDGKFLACFADHEAYAAPRASTIQLDVSYAPKVKLKLDNNSKLREHGSALLSCDVVAKPLENVKIAWYRNGKEISVTTDTLSFPDLRIDHHNSEYTCSATNSIGESSDSIVLNITYGAYIISSEQHQAVSPGDRATFTCDAIGNPAPVIHWIKVGDDQVIARGPNLTVDSVQSWQRGEYECIATVQDFPPARLHHYLHIKGPPTVSLSDEIVATNGENLEIICEVRGRPQPHDIIWLFNDALLEYGRPGGRLQINQVPRQFGVESRLTIHKIRDSDFGIYNCSAYNEFGSDFQTMELKHKSMMDAVIGALPSVYLVPLIIVAITVIILLICCPFWQCRHTHCKKPASFSDDHPDVTVKCEALDGGQFFPEMYNSASNESHELLCPKDYTSIPQNNPDLDYLPPPPFMNGTVYTQYGVLPVDYIISDPTMHIDHNTYNSYASNISTPVGTVSEAYAYNGSKGSAALETLTEVPTPDTDCASPLMNGQMKVIERPVSRTSTHV